MTANKKPRIFEYGEASKAIALGYVMQQTAQGTAAEISIHFEGDFIAVYGAAVMGMPYVYEFAIFGKPDCWVPFDAKYPPAGNRQYYIVVKSMKYDVDVDDYGCYIGSPIGYFLRVALMNLDVYIDDEGNDKIVFSPIDAANLGELDSESECVTHYRRFEMPALPLDDKAKVGHL